VGRDSLSRTWVGLCAAQAGEVFPMQDYINSNQLEAEHEYHRHRHGQVEFFCG
jgi:hypothetical protein